MEYPKIETLWNRDPHDMKLVLAGDLRCEEFGLVDKWLITEKVDGTNVRVVLSQAALYVNPQVSFFGRTDAAQFHPDLSAYLERTFTLDKLVPTFESDEGDLPTEVTLFGEGYGPKIQKGGSYRGDISFRLFDVVVRTTQDWWLNWYGVEDIAEKLEIKTVPVISRDQSLGEAQQNCLDLYSRVASEDNPQPYPGYGLFQEGIVARTDPLLFMRNGHRLMWKLKRRDMGLQKNA